MALKHAVMMGATTYTPLVVGQNASELPKKNSLGLEFFYVGEPVAVVRSDGRSMIGQIIAASDKSANIDCGGGVIKHIPAPQAPTLISKLLGTYCVTGQVTVPPLLVDGAAHPGFNPLELGEDTGTIVQRDGISSEYYFVGEAVSVVRSNGGRTIARIVSVTNEYDVVVWLGGALEKRISAADVPKLISKVIGAYYLRNSSSVAEPAPLTPASQRARNSMNFLETLEETDEVCVFLDTWFSFYQIRFVIVFQRKEAESMLCQLQGSSSSKEAQHPRRDSRIEGIQGFDGQI